jgi:hypothetical protein
VDLHLGQRSRNRDESVGIRFHAGGFGFAGMAAYPARGRVLGQRGGCDRHHRRRLPQRHVSMDESHRRLLRWRLRDEPATMVRLAGGSGRCPLVLRPVPLRRRGDPRRFRRCGLGGGVAGRPYLRCAPGGDSAAARAGPLPASSRGERCATTPRGREDPHRPRAPRHHRSHGQCDGGPRRGRERGGGLRQRWR